MANADENLSSIMRAYARWYSSDYINHLVEEDEFSRSELERDWSNPVSLTPVPQTALDEAEKSFGPLPAEYIAFMREIGSGHILAADEEGPHIFDVPSPIEAVTVVKDHAQRLAYGLEKSDEHDHDDWYDYVRYVHAQAPGYGNDWLVIAHNEEVFALLAYRGELVGQVTLTRRGEAYTTGQPATGLCVPFATFWDAFFGAARNLSPILCDNDLREVVATLHSRPSQ